MLKKGNSDAFFKEKHLTKNSSSILRMSKPRIKREYLVRPDRNEWSCHKAHRQEPQIILCPACQMSLQYFFNGKQNTDHATDQ